MKRIYDWQELSSKIYDHMLSVDPETKPKFGLRPMARLLSEGRDKPYSTFTMRQALAFLVEVDLINPPEPGTRGYTLKNHKVTKKALAAGFCEGLLSWEQQMYSLVLFGMRRKKDPIRSCNAAAKLCGVSFKKMKPIFDQAERKYLHELRVKQEEADQADLLDQEIPEAQGHYPRVKKND